MDFQWSSLGGGLFDERRECYLELVVVFPAHFLTFLVEIEDVSSQPAGLSVIHGEIVSSQTHE